MLFFCASRCIGVERCAFRHIVVMVSGHLLRLVPPAGLSRYSPIHFPQLPPPLFVIPLLPVVGLVVLLLWV